RVGNSRCLEHPGRSLCAQLGTGLALHHPVTLADAGALGDPLVRSVHHRGEVVIGHDPRRDGVTGADDAGLWRHRWLASNRNQTRPSASSTQFSINDAVAMSSCSSQSPCSSRSRAIISRLSSRSSASIVCGGTNSLSLSSTRCKRAICPI